VDTKDLIFARCFHCYLCWFLYCTVVLLTLICWARGAFASRTRTVGRRVEVSAKYQAWMTNDRGDWSTPPPTQLPTHAIGLLYLPAKFGGIGIRSPYTLPLPLLSSFPWPALYALPPTVSSNLQLAGWQHPTLTYKPPIHPLEIQNL
jgi:hypothetical protein